MQWAWLGLDTRAIRLRLVILIVYFMAGLGMVIAFTVGLQFDLSYG